jgi:GNAT superfamily N-acetyltransferase
MSTVRRAVPDDVEDIARVQVRSWQVAYRGVVPDAHLDGLRWEDRVDSWREAFTEPPVPGRSVFVAVDEGTVTGFAACGPGEEAFELFAIYVLPGRWGHGDGPALMRAVLEVAPLPIVLWVLAANPRGRRFYEKEGFALDGATHVRDIGGKQLELVRYRRG